MARETSAQQIAAGELTNQCRGATPSASECRGGSNLCVLRGLSPRAPRLKASREVLRKISVLNSCHSDAERSGGRRNLLFAIELRSLAVKDSSGHSPPHFCAPPSHPTAS